MTRFYTISLDDSRQKAYDYGNKKRPVRVLITLRTSLTNEPEKEVTLATFTIPVFPLPRQFRDPSPRPGHRSVCAVMV